MNIDTETSKKDENIYRSEKRIIIPSRHLQMYKQMYKYSEQVYKIVFTRKTHYLNNFYLILNDLNTNGIFPYYTQYELLNREYKFKELYNENSDISKYSEKILSLKNKMLSKLHEFKEKFYKPKGENQLQNQIFYNYAHYEIRDYIEQYMNAEIVTNAWVKMYDLLMGIDMNFIKKIKSFKCFHICELPGGFISAINHFIKTKTNLKYEWIAESLFDTKNKNMIGDDYGLYEHYKDHYDLGSSGDGDMYNEKNIEYYINKYWDTEFFLVTSDCGEDSDISFETKEDKMWKIHWHQFILAIGLNNHFYFGKIYSSYSDNINKLVMLAQLFYERVTLKRPYTTKITSDEIYILCKYKKKFDRTIWKDLMKLDINKIKLPEEFHKEMYKINMAITYRRITNINLYLFVLRNIDFIKETNNEHEKKFGIRNIYETTRMTRNYFIKTYVKRLGIQKINDKDKLLATPIKKGNWTHNFSI